MTPRERLTADAIWISFLLAMAPAVWWRVKWPMGVVLAVALLTMVWLSVLAAWRWWRAPRCFNPTCGGRCEATHGPPRTVRKARTGR